MGPYPDRPDDVVGFKYCDDLYLTRSIKAVRGRKGEDAEYVVAKDYKCRVSMKCTSGFDYAHQIIVPKGFLTDLSTVPWYGRWLVSRVGPHLEASIVHDWLFVAWQPKCCYRLPDEDMRSFADAVFLAAMKEAKVCPFRRWLIYWVSRLGGKMPLLWKRGTPIRQEYCKSLLAQNLLG